MCFPGVPNQLQLDQFDLNPASGKPLHSAFLEFLVSDREDKRCSCRLC
jgi:hypothetical protein